MQIVDQPEPTQGRSSPIALPSTDSTPDMLLPKDKSLPFFSYGIFRPGEVAYFRIRDFVEVQTPARVEGQLFLRDGLLIGDQRGTGEIDGAMLTFKSLGSKDAYHAIAEIEPRKQYRWDEVSIAGTRANILWGVSPKKGSTSLDFKWSSWDDPLFTDALEVVEETLASNLEWEWDTKQAFRVQMAYLLLWNAIERYTSLRYQLGGNATSKVKRLADEAAFASGLGCLPAVVRSVQRADDPGQRVTFDPNDPKKSLEYYYQVRSNMVHRGKAMARDHRIVVESCGQLIGLFKQALAKAQRDAVN
jgi:hypothetical protein